MKRSLLGLAVLGAVAAVPVVLRAPRPVRSLPGRESQEFAWLSRERGAEPRQVSLPQPIPGTIDALAGDCRASGLTGWPLVDYATALVNRRFVKYSVWHFWESPRRALAMRRGYSDQYNLALAGLLRRLGFQVQVVHAARVRLDAHPEVPTPWWRTGHTWLRVSHAGQTRDVSAGQDGNTAGNVGFTPVSDVRPVHRWTHLSIRLGMALFVIAAVWRSLLTGRPAPGWIYRDFHRSVG